MDEKLRRWAAGPKCSVTRASEILGVSRDTVRRMILQGDLYAWRPNPRGRKKMLYLRQVSELAGATQEEAVKHGRLMQSSFDFF